jgi:hypothetical protein
MVPMITLRSTDYRSLIYAVLCAVALQWAVGIVWAEDSSGGLTIAQKGEAVDSTIKRIKKTLEFTLKRLETAESNKDIIQVNCVNDKLTGIKGFLRIAERSHKSLLEAMGERDAELVQHEYAKVSIVSLRVENLKLEVEGCVGELSQYTGNSELTVEVDETIRKDDPSTAATTPTFDALNIVRPPAVTGSE